jgi:hypothetical protein
MRTQPPGYREIWHEAPDGGSLCALINDIRGIGWLMYLREYGDAGFSSRNPEYTGPADATEYFWLSNGQCDSYPVAYCYPVAVIDKALDHFKSTGLPPTFINWFNDSRDGKDIIPRQPRYGERSGSAG